MRLIALPARRQGRGAEPRRARDRRPRSSPSPTRTRPGRPTRCASSCARSPTRTSPTSAAGSSLEDADGDERGGRSTGASRPGCASRSRGSARSPAATARSTPCAARDYVEVDPRFGHDLSLPYLMVQRGRRAVYEPAALAFEKPTPTNEDEYRRKVRMFEHCWLIVLRGRMLRGLPPLYLRRARLAPAPSLRQRRCCTSSLLGSSVALVARRRALRASCSAAQLALLAAAAAGVGLARYYVARHAGRRVVALWNYLRRGVPADVGRPRRGRAEPRRSTSPSPASGSPSRRPCSRSRRAGDQARGRRAGALPADARRQGRRRLRAAQAADDGRRRRAEGRRLRRRPRATRASRGSAALLRRLSLDELPQLWNVAPRRHEPDRAAADARATRSSSTRRASARRLEVKPGITGWAQIHGRAPLPWAERIELDVWYVEHRSPRLDLKILAAHAARALQRHLQGRDRRLADPPRVQAR